MPKPTPVPEIDPLITWRTDRITDLGYHPEDADLWANLGIDWHQLQHLIDTGCPHDLAIHILA
jgi:hypothetical protein